MPTPEFIVALREKVGHDDLWLPGVTAIVTDAADRLLLVRRADSGAWTPVTGIVDPLEEPALAAAREVLEEADVVAEPEWLVSVDVVGPVVYGNGDRSSYLDLCFALRHVSGRPHPADGENTDARWFARDALPPMNARFTRLIELAARGAEAAFFVGRAGDETETRAENRADGSAHTRADT